MKWAYYNEKDPNAAAWLRELIKSNLIMQGEVDERDIRDVRPRDVEGFVRCHFFAGIGGWDRALQEAAWPADLPVWTGSAPCQPFSAAGRRGGFADERHLWPFWHHLISVRKPAIVFGEQVASAADWLRLVRGDLEALDYAVGCCPVEAASAGADHLRDRFWFVGDLASERRGEGWPEHEIRSWRTATAGGSGADGNVSDATGEQARPTGQPRKRERVEWVIGADGKARRVVSDFRLLAHGLSTRMGGCGYGDIREANEKVRAYGQTSSQRPTQILFAVWQGVLANPEPYEAVAQQAGICQAEILLAFLRQLDWSGSEGDVPFSSEKKFEDAVRSVRRSTFHARTSRRWQSFEQRAQQHPDSLQALSRVLAQHAQAAWTAYRSENAKTLDLLVKNFPNRVGLLRGFGNAIDPRPAAAFIKASFLAIADSRRSAIADGCKMR